MTEPNQYFKINLNTKNRKDLKNKSPQQIDPTIGSKLRSVQLIKIEVKTTAKGLIEPTIH